MMVPRGGSIALEHTIAVRITAWPRPKALPADLPENSECPAIRFRFHLNCSCTRQTSETKECLVAAATDRPFGFSGSKAAL